MKRRSMSSDAVDVAIGDEGLICLPYLVDTMVRSMTLAGRPDGEKLSGLGSSGDGGFASMEDEDCGDEELCSGRSGAICPRAGGTSGGGSEKKRRLSSEQVRALERSFEVENKLEAERKVRLAKEIGLEPRQVAVWFQNRRARRKTKQLERDYLQLRSSYDALHADHRALLAEVTELRGKVADRTAPRPGTCSTASMTLEEQPAGLSDSSGRQIACAEPGEEVVETEAGAEVDEEVPLPDVDPAALVYKDGTSSTGSSDSSAVLNVCEDDTTGLYSLVHHPQQFPGSPFRHDSHKQIGQDQLPSSFQSPPPAVRMVEKQYFLTGDDGGGGSFFADEQFSILPWYCSDRWS